MRSLGRDAYGKATWYPHRLLRLIDVVDWEAERDGQTTRMREFCFVVDVEGDLNAPQLEYEKFTEYRWVGKDDLELLKEHRPEGDKVIFDLVRKGLDLAREVRRGRVEDSR